MSETTYPYETRLDILFKQGELIDTNKIVEANTFEWFNQTLCEVNDAVVRIGIVKGEYHWHKHDADDEFFFTLEGKLFVDLEDRTVELGPGQGFVVQGQAQRCGPRGPRKACP